MINYQKYIKEVKNQINKVIEGESLILGPEVCKLEEEIARYFGIKYAIGVNSGTDALIYSLKSLGINPGDEVICPVFTFIATAEAIIWSGARPVFVDVEPRTLNIDPNSIEKSITCRTKVIIPVHLYGQSVDMGRILRITRIYKLKVIEDVAQAFGAKYYNKKVGSMGNSGCLSFFPSKILGGFGDGGMILTNNSKLAKRVKMMRINGASEIKKIYYDHRIIGGSSRLDEIQATALRVQFKYIKQNLEYRQRIAKEYNKILKGTGDLILPLAIQGNKHAYNFYVIRTNFRDKLKEFLAVHNIKTFALYPKPLHLFSVFKFLGYKKGDFPEAEKAANQVLALPINQFLPLTKVREIVNLIKIFFNEL